ncbi:MAG: response regulator [Paludibacteraceae bacterium]|nr:response regulator [Paludibacteraceae bacterium]
MKKLASIITLLIVYAVSAFAERVEYAHFSHFSTDDGMMTNKSESITQDDRGFIWIATDFGLDRFDGSNFRHFSKENYPEIPRDNFLFVSHVGNGKIVAGGMNGLLVEYDPSTDKVKNKMPADFDKTYYKMTHGVTVDDEGTIYAFTNGGLYIYDNEKQEFSNDHPAYNALTGAFIRSLYVDNQHRYWTGLGDGVSVYGRNGGQLMEYKGDRPEMVVNSIIPLTNGDIAATSFSNQLWIFNSVKINERPRVVTLPFNNTTRIIQAKNGRCWFSSDGDGLWYTDNIEAEQPDFVNLRPYENNGETMKKLYTVIEDFNGDIWVSTQNSGIWCYHTQQVRGISFSSEQGFPNHVCSDFTEDLDGNLIIATDGSGVFRKTDNTFRQYKFGCNNVLGIDRDKNGNMLLATWGDGLQSLNLNTGVSQLVKMDGIAPYNNIFSICQMEDGEKYCGSAGDGMYVMDENGKWSKRILADDSLAKMPNKWIYKIVEKNDIRWILTTNTIWRVEKGVYKAMMKDLATIKSVCPLSLIDIDCDEHSNLYVGTNEGVLRIASDGSEVKKITAIDSCEFRVVCSDGKGKIWFGGLGKVLWYDPINNTSGSLPGYYGNMSKYLFYSRSGYLSKDGHVYMGTNTGYLCFAPNEIQVTKNIKYMDFSTFYISQEKQYTLHNVSELILKHNQTDIAIDIDLVDYSQTGAAALRYRLKGLNDDWKEVEKSRRISFNYIPEGDYLLEVEAKSATSFTSVQSLTLPLKVLPPWWKAWWCYLLEVILVLAIIFIVYRTKMRQQEALKNELRQKVAERTEELNVALKEKDRLISVIAHDLRNPMFGIVASLDSVLAQEMVNIKKSSLVDIRNAASMLQGEMQKLLAWAQSNTSQFAVRMSDVDLKQSVENEVRLLNELLVAKNIEVVTNIDYSYCAKADIRQLEVVVRNLLNNALKFTNEGGRITVDGNELQSELLLKISDNGVGMSPAQLENLLSSGKHESTEGTTGEKGSGLGFSLCQEYMKQMNGKISVESKEGVGTSISLYFKKSTAKVNNKIVSEETTESTYTPQEDSALNESVILVVDDDEMVLKSIVSMLEPYATVLTANDGAAALNMSKNEQPDVIVSDVEMPIMDGFTLNKSLQASPETSHIPLLFVSARTEDEMRLEGLGTGAVDYITKPFSQKELLLKLQSIINVKRNTQNRILSTIVEPDAMEKTEEMDPFLKRVIKVIEENYSDSDFSIEVLARESAVSQSTLTRKVKVLTGKTPLEIITDYRLNMAHSLLTTERISVADVAYRVGFSDPAYFTRKYKQFFGRVPSQR